MLLMGGSVVGNSRRVYWLISGRINQVRNANAVIHDVLQRLNISVSKLRGQCYNGASAMSGSKQGVATKLQPRAVYTHCYGHALNLACGDTIKKSKIALDTVYEIVKLVIKSPRRDATLHKTKQEMPEGSPGITVLCPTRWTDRADAM